MATVSVWPVALIAAGSILVWSGVQNRQPLEVAKEVLTGAKPAPGIQKKTSAGVWSNAPIETGQSPSGGGGGIYSFPLGGSGKLTVARGFTGTHDGVDMSRAPTTGKPVLAYFAGRVVKAQWNGGYGNYVEIDHGGGLSSFYGHLSRLNVRPGQQVTTGAVVGSAGNTGRSTGAHLHFGMHQNGAPIDPMPSLKKVWKP